MTFTGQPVLARVPATSANLGPGFDSLGLALAHWDEVEARVTSRGLAVEVTGQGAETARDPAGHLVVRAALAAFERMGVSAPGLALRCRNTIPHGRGLGSSAAAIVAGVLCARALTADGARRLDDAAVLGLAVELEGHPDNVAACLRGGLTIAWRPGGPPVPGPAVGGPGEKPVGGAGAGGPGELPGGGASAGNGVTERGDAGVRVARLDVAGEVSAVVCVAPGELGTREARGALPGSVPHAEAAANAGRAALLVAALTQRPELLFAATEDFLHQRYRAPLMPDTAALVVRLRGAGMAAVVSGAGPSVLVLTGESGGAAATAVDSIAAEMGIAWHVIPLKIDRRGATAQPGQLSEHPPGSGWHGTSWHHSGVPLASPETARPGSTGAGGSPPDQPPFATN